MKPSILIINKAQFGYHTDSYKYCQYLKEEFDITYLCFNTNKEKYSQKGINVIYVAWHGSFLRKGFDFIRYSLKYLGRHNPDIVFTVYFPFCFLIKLLTGKKTILDIRTGSVHASKLKRNLFNLILRFESLFFKHITIISPSLQKKLRIKKAQIIPLGADTLSTKSKVFDYPRLLYVGTLHNRNIDKTVIGFKKFIIENKIEKISYDIVGYGSPFEEALLQKTIAENGLLDIVKFHGRKYHNELQSYFDDCNIGVSFIPITTYFDCQPPTKTFEYINAGMVCIATSTSENRPLINKDNGVLCDDNPDGFAKALSQVLQRKDNYSSNAIRTTLKEYNWGAISIQLSLYLKTLNNC